MSGVVGSVETLAVEYFEDEFPATAHWVESPRDSGWWELHGGPLGPVVSRASVVDEQIAVLQALKGHLAGAL